MLSKTILSFRYCTGIYLEGIPGTTTGEMSQSYPPPFKVLEKVLEWTFLKSSGKLFELIEFCASSGKNKGSSGKSMEKFWKAKSSGKSIKKFWKT